MPNWTRLVVTLKANAPVPDVSAILRRLRQSYRIGYCGLFEVDKSLRLYIQTTGNAARMTPSKVLKLCERFGAEGVPETFKRREGTLLAEKGEFREVGAPKGPRNKAAVGEGRTTTINNISNTQNTHNDHCIFNDNREIHIHLNALGSEDVSHIGMEQFKTLFNGSTEEIINLMRGMMSPELYSRTIEVAWTQLQSDLYDKRFMAPSDQAAPNEAPPGEESPPGEAPAGEEPADESPAASAESDTESEGPDEGPAYELVEVDGALIKYDGGQSSEYNRRAKEKVGNIAICDLKASADAAELPAQFARLLSENLSNCNILHPKNAGYFEYFDGATWVKNRTQDVETIVSVWEDKVKECFKLLEERHGDAWLQSFQALYAANVIGKFRSRHVQKSYKKYVDTQVKRAALLAVDNANARIKAVESRTGKRVRRVCSEDEGESRKRKIHRNVLWGELMNQF